MVGGGGESGYHEGAVLGDGEEQVWCMEVEDEACDKGSVASELGEDTVALDLIHDNIRAKASSNEGASGIKSKGLQCSCGLPVVS